jgi:hypothetical protein
MVKEYSTFMNTNEESTEEIAESISKLKNLIIIDIDLS